MFHDAQDFTPLILDKPSVTGGIDQIHRQHRYAASDESADP
jgi:hypothetical protein